MRGDEEKLRLCQVAGRRGGPVGLRDPPQPSGQRPLPWPARSSCGSHTDSAPVLVPGSPFFPLPPAHRQVSVSWPAGRPAKRPMETSRWFCRDQPCCPPRPSKGRAEKSRETELRGKGVSAEVRRASTSEWLSLCSHRPVGGGPGDGRNQAPPPDPRGHDYLPECRCGWFSVSQAPNMAPGAQSALRALGQVGS